MVPVDVIEVLSRVLGLQVRNKAFAMHDRVSRNCGEAREAEGHHLGMQPKAASLVHNCTKLSRIRYRLQYFIRAEKGAEARRKEAPTLNCGNQRTLQTHLVLILRALLHRAIVIEADRRPTCFIEMIEGLFVESDSNSEDRG